MTACVIVVTGHTLTFHLKRSQETSLTVNVTQELLHRHGCAQRLTCRLHVSVVLGRSGKVDLLRGSEGN